MPLPHLTYVDKVGIELEGGWNRRFTDARIIYDMSVQRPANTTGRVCCCKEGHGDGSTCHFGEIPSPPLPLEEALFWMRDHYPDGVNQSCGFHVHLSVKHPLINYPKLMEKRFYDLFLSEVAKWGKKEGFPANHQLWHRLTSKDYKNGPARFCNRPFNPIIQTTTLDKPDSRRSALNYCYLKHGTIECRIFPSFEDPALAARAVILYATTVENYLQSAPAPRKDIIRFFKPIEEISSTFEPLQG